MKHARPSLLALPALAILVAGVAVPRADDVPAAAPAPAEPAAAPEPLAEGPVAALAEPAVAIGEASLDAALGRWVAPAGDARAILTLDAALQARLTRALESYRVPWGATVLLEPATGRVLALAEHSRAEPARRGLALAALAPAASIFKIVTAAALLEQGVGPDGEVCYHGGKRRLQPGLLRDDPRRDRRCLSLSAAFGHSANVVFAKLADRDLDPALLRTAAERFLFNAPIPFSREVEVSTAEIPSDPFDVANTAAGFGEVKLTALHGALLAAIVANRGVMVPPVLVDAVEGGPLPAAPAPWRVVDEGVAGALADMMRETVTAGTARRAFRRVASSLRGVQVAGKTGSLADPSPYRDYSWFVGYAPADRPTVAVATVVVNDRLWHARATTVAKEALEAYFATRVAGVSGGVRTAAVR
jgi:cell division protein FtsI/penicillin-binding protein 2